MPSASSSSSSSLYIIGDSSRLRDDPIIEVGDMDEDGSSGGALSGLVAERFASSFETQGSIDALCRKYGVPEQYSAVLPAGHQRACSPPGSAVSVYAHALEAGMRVPLHGFFCEVLAHFGVAPSQIAPNGWRAMAGFVVLSHSAGVAPSLPVFRHFFSLCAFKLKGWYYFRGKDAAGLLFKGMPLSIAGWKEAFFFLKSPTPWPCPVKWGGLSMGSTVEPALTREEQSVAKKLLRVHGAAVDIMTYLSESNLAAATIAGSSAKPPPPPIGTTSSASAKGNSSTPGTPNLPSLGL
jgi:hypothetical protein